MQHPQQQLAVRTGPGALGLDRHAELTELVADPHVLLDEEARRRREVVGRDGRQRRGAPLRRRQLLALLDLEPQHRAAEHPCSVEGLAHPDLDGAQVLADDDGARAVRFEQDHSEHRLRVVGHERALRGGPARGDPPQPEQAHDVVDPQTPGVPQGASYDVAQRVVAELGEAVRAPGRQPPVLALLVEQVGRGADRGRQRERVLQRPRVRATGVDPHREVVDHPDGHGVAETGQLLVHQQLHPAPEGDPVGQLDGGLRDGRRLGAPERLRPRLPRHPVHLGEGAEDGVLLQREPLLDAPGGKRLGPVQGPEQP